MPIIDDVLEGLQIQINTLWYNVMLSLAGIHWSVLRAFIMMGYTIEVLDRWLADNAFAPLIQQTNSSLQLVTSLAFIVALLVLGITYLFAAFARLRVVEPKSALAWYVAGALFFALGPSLYSGMTDFRRDVSQAFYASTLSGLSGATGGTFSALGSVETSDLGILPLCDNLGDYLPVRGAPTIDGLDIALAYLRADGIDIMGYHPASRDIRCQPHPPDIITGRYTAGPIPWEWRRPGSFFDNTRDPVFFGAMTVEERAESLAQASSAHARMLTSWALVLFGVAEQLVHLLLTIAQGLTFLSFAVAILFAFFKKTEAIARSIIDLWIELIIQTIVIALIQALVTAFFLAATASGSGIVILGIGLICLVFIILVLLSGFRAVWNGFNRLFAALGQATGGSVMSPAVAAAVGIAGGTAVAAGGALLAGNAVSGGANLLAGMSALQQGGTLAQAAGLTLGGVNSLTGASRTLSYLPGVRGTALGDAAEQFTEGALTRQVARRVPLVGRVTGPMIGAGLLTNRDSDAADYDREGRLLARPMLIPAVGASLGGWTTPDGKSPKRPVPADVQMVEGIDGELYPLPSSRRRSQRMGMFTPATTLDNPTSNNPETPLVGELRVTGAAEVASVIGDAIRQVQAERIPAGQSTQEQLGHLGVAQALAREMGVAPAAEGVPPIKADIARFGLFVDQALRLGLSGDQAEGIVREVKASPDRALEPETRSALVTQVQSERRRDWNHAERDVRRLEAAAQLLPDEISAYGQVKLPPPSKTGEEHR